MLFAQPRFSSGTDAAGFTQNPPWFLCFVLKKAEQLSFLRNSVSEPPRTAVVPRSSEFLLLQKLVLKDVQGRTSLS